MMRFLVAATLIVLFVATGLHAQITKGIGNPESITGTVGKSNTGGGQKQQTTGTPSKSQQSAEERKKAAAATKAVNTAIAELVKEYQSYLKDPANSRIRDSADYFKGKPSPDVTPDAIIQALGRNANADPRSVAYAKWQILSGVSDKIDDKNITAALSAFKSMVPSLTPRPGISQQSRQLLDRFIAGKQKGDIDSLESEFQKQVDEAQNSNMPIFKYREELYLRLPQRPEVFVAGFQDAWDRVQNGWNPDPVLKTVISDVSNWAVDPKTTPQQLHQMAKLINNLADQKKIKKYDHVQWDEGKYVVNWSDWDHGWPDVKVLKDVAAELAEKANNPNSGLKFKEK